MKPIIFVFCLLLSGLVNAASGKLSFQLHAVSLVDLCRVVLDDVGGASLVLDSEILKDQNEVSFTLKQVDQETAIHHLRDLLRVRGFVLEKSGSVYSVKRAPVDDEELFVYSPKYRSVSYLSDLLGAVVGHGSVVTQRIVQSPSSGQSGQSVLHAPAGQSVSQDRPNSAASLIDRADKDTLVIKSTPAKISMAKRIISETDKPIPEMLIKAVVLEVQSTSSEGSAVNLVASFLSGGKGVTLTSSGAANGQNALSIKLGGFEALWSAISSDKRFKVVSSPRVLVKSGSNARFSVGADVPILGAVNYQGNGQAVQSVEYKPSGVILDLSPQIRGDLAELKVFQQLSSFAKTENGVNGSPTLLKRELTTTVVVAQNDVVLLGGLDEEKHTTDDSGLFFLPDFMRSKARDKSKSEIVLLLYVERVRTPGEVI